MVSIIFCVNSRDSKFYASIRARVVIRARKILEIVLSSCFLSCFLQRLQGFCILLEMQIEPRNLLLPFGRINRFSDCSILIPTCPMHHCFELLLSTAFADAIASHPAGSVD